MSTTAKSTKYDDQIRALYGAALTARDHGDLLASRAAALILASIFDTYPTLESMVIGSDSQYSDEGGYYTSLHLIQASGVDEDQQEEISDAIWEAGADDLLRACGVSVYSEATITREEAQAWAVEYAGASDG